MQFGELARAARRDCSARRAIQLSICAMLLARKRPLTLPMIRALHEKLDIPPALLIREPAGVYRVRSAVKRPVRSAKRVAR